MARRKNMTLQVRLIAFASKAFCSFEFEDCSNFGVIEGGGFDGAAISLANSAEVLVGHCSQFGLRFFSAKTESEIFYCHPAVARIQPEKQAAAKATELGDAG